MTEQQDLSLRREDAEHIVGGKKASKKNEPPKYVPGDTHVVTPASSGMAGDTSTIDDGC